MAGVSGDPGTVAGEGIAGKAEVYSVPQPVRGNPSNH